MYQSVQILTLTQRTTARIRGLLPTTLSEATESVLPIKKSVRFSPALDKPTKPSVILCGTGM